MHPNKALHKKISCKESNVVSTNGKTFSWVALKGILQEINKSKFK